MHRYTDRSSDRHTDAQIDTQMYRETHRCPDRHTFALTDTQIHIPWHRQIHRCARRHYTNLHWLIRRSADKHMQRRTDEHTDAQKWVRKRVDMSHLLNVEMAGNLPWERLITGDGPCIFCLSVFLVLQIEPLWIQNSLRLGLIQFEEWMNKRLRFSAQVHGNDASGLQNFGTLLCWIVVFCESDLREVYLKLITTFLNS